ncbi:uncharacterized protein LOC123528782 isoform X2 [Mercenaria mercenaria]|uniref:uncharacterized protein LOC123528782 isoform X2 n=1 Tax=Mercenaria mercenaria TaxID=6596 RepID=UPI001E1D310D|nr:uncharacterized protein LOC123528782 isoform X2 [Mercenaria mercenaria]
MLQSLVKPQIGRTVYYVCMEISAGQLYARDKLYYVSEPTEEVDHVTSGEQCSARAGRLLQANTTVSNASSVIKELNLTANRSYWLEGSVPTYLSTNSCLLLSNAATIMAVGCQQRHNYICEIDMSFLYTISATRSTDYRMIHSSSTNSGISDHTSGFQLQTSYMYHYKPSITDIDRHVSDSLSYRTISSTKFLPVSTEEHILHSPTPTYRSVSPTASQTQPVVDLHTSTPMTNQHTASLNAQTLVSGNPNYTQLICNRYCSSLDISELLHMIRNRSTAGAVHSNTYIMNDSLAVNAKETGKARRRLTSAMDSRTSSRAIGGLAVFIIILVPVCVILMDLPLLIKLWTCFKSRH